MRRLFTTAEAVSGGLTSAALRWGDRTGRWRRVGRGVYADGPDEPSALDWARADVLRADGFAVGVLAGVLHGLDGLHGIRLDARPTCRRTVPGFTVIEGVRCADGRQTLVDLAPVLGDDRWEQALESAVRRRLTRISDLERALTDLGRARVPGTTRIRRVLARRPPGAAPTESLLETLMVQLARAVPGLPEPVRQFRVFDRYGMFVARVDLAWPELGLFVELDGQHHKDQPLHDARRETAVVAATGWLPGRFTWAEVVSYRASTRRRLAALVDQCGRRVGRLQREPSRRQA